MKCPCHSQKEYEECCKPYHEAKAAPTPLLLMRSRYSAYALGNVEYIIETTHPDLVHTVQNRDELVAFCKNSTFHSLTILATTGDTVTFKAGLSQNGQDISFVEKSLFKQVAGKWKYHSRLRS